MKDVTIPDLRDRSALKDRDLSSTEVRDVPMDRDLSSTEARDVPTDRDLSLTRTREDLMARAIRATISTARVPPTIPLQSAARI